MSLPGLNSAGPGRGEGESSTLITVMLVVAAIFMVVGTIILSVPLHTCYQKFFWNVR